VTAVIAAESEARHATHTVIRRRRPFLMRTRPRQYRPLPSLARPSLLHRPDCKHSKIFLHPLGRSNLNPVWATRGTAGYACNTSSTIVGRANPARLTTKFSFRLRGHRSVDCGGGSYVHARTEGCASCACRSAAVTFGPGALMSFPTPPNERLSVAKTAYSPKTPQKSQ
jgi:hypothetical protein